MTVTGVPQEERYPPNTGCELWHDCLTCPLDKCIEDLRREWKPKKKKLRRDTVAMR